MGVNRFVRATIDDVFLISIRDMYTKSHEKNWTH